jgi:hypothetical protein
LFRRRNNPFDLGRQADGQAYVNMGGAGTADSSAPRQPLGSRERCRTAPAQRLADELLRRGRTVPETIHADMSAHVSRILVAPGDAVDEDATLSWSPSASRRETT